MKNFSFDKNAKKVVKPSSPKSPCTAVRKNKKFEPRASRKIEQITP
jgi:hypothetical protein